jgi:hypothetical protein
MSVSEFPGRAVGTPIEPPPALPERSFLAFDPPRGRVKSIARIRIEGATNVPHQYTHFCLAVLSIKRSGALDKCEPAG